MHLSNTNRSTLFYVLVSFILFSSCTKQIAKSTDNRNASQEEYTTSLQEEIDKHGTIKIQVKQDGKTVKKEITRSKVDSLDLHQLTKVNEFLSGLDAQYTSKNDFIFIQFYPGKDPCNSTGMANRNDIGKSTEKFIAEVSTRENISLIYIYKSSEGLKRWDKGVQWQSDNKQIIEDTFFEYHYPCSSYVILHKDGLYYSYFGESWAEKKVLDIDLFTYHF